MPDLRRIPNLNNADVRVAEFVFEFVQFLLDDDANLTPAGNLTGAARQRLRSRVEELLTAEEAGGAEVTASVGDDLTETLLPAATTEAEGL